MVLAVKRYVIEKEYPLPREAVWKLLSDTEHLNEFIGLFPVRFSPAKKGHGDVFYREALAKVAGMIPLNWREYPFQWTENENYSVERRYQGGPLKHFVGGVELLDGEMMLPEGSKKTKVRLFGEFTPRNLLGLAAIPITGLKSMQNTMTYIDDCLKNTNEGTDIYLPLKSSKIKVNLTELDRLEKECQNLPIHADFIGLLHRHLVERSDQEVVKMRAMPIARLWGADPEQVLRLFLYATKTGILNLSWNLICPNCRVSKAEYTSLSQLEGQFHCDLCGINYDANFENYVELYFSVHPTIRQAVSHTYCVGGPMITPHVKVQKVIEKGQMLKLNMPHSDKNLRCRVLQANHIVSIETKQEQSKGETALYYDDDGWSETAISVKTKGDPINIFNSSSSDIVVVLEQAEWSHEVTTAAKVTAMQEFRDLFSSEVLSPGQQVGIENVTILFSDLLGSTSLYESIGDANAYGQVRRHFEFLKLWISKNSGSVVKTIGDAVMAVFHLPEDGLQAAIDIQKHVSEFNQESADDMTLKIGLYSGPAIAVNSNDQLDYFGRTVNIAARVQGQSVGHDIVLSHDYLNIEAIRSIFKKEEIEYHPFQATLKGISGDVDLIRVKVTNS